MIGIIYLKNKITNTQEILGVYSCEVDARNDYNLLMKAIEAHSDVLKTEIV